MAKDLHIPLSTENEVSFHLWGIFKSSPLTEDCKLEKVQKIQEVPDWVSMCYLHYCKPESWSFNALKYVAYSKYKFGGGRDFVLLGSYDSSNARKTDLNLQLQDAENDGSTYAEGWIDHCRDYIESGLQQKSGHFFRHHPNLSTIRVYRENPSDKHSHFKAEDHFFTVSVVRNIAGIEVKAVPTGNAIKYDSTAKVLARIERRKAFVEDSLKTEELKEVQRKEFYFLIQKFTAAEVPNDFSFKGFSDSYFLNSIYRGEFGGFLYLGEKGYFDSPANREFAANRNSIRFFAYLLAYSSLCSSKDTTLSRYVTKYKTTVFEGLVKIDEREGEYNVYYVKPEYLNFFKNMELLFMTNGMFGVLYGDKGMLLPTAYNTYTELISKLGCSSGVLTRLEINHYLLLQQKFSVQELQ